MLSHLVNAILDYFTTVNLTEKPNFFPTSEKWTFNLSEVFFFVAYVLNPYQDDNLPDIR